METKSKSNVIWWLKKGFRLSDNPALTAALARGLNVVPIFVIEPSATSAKTAPETSAFHVAAWLEAVKGLRKRLRAVGGDLSVLHGEGVDVFQELKQRIDFNHVVSHEEVGTWRTFERDRAFGAWCNGNQVVWEEHRQTGVFRRFNDRDKRTIVWNQWMNQGPLPAPAKSELKRVRVPEKVFEIQTAPARQPLLKSFGFEMDQKSRRLRQKVTESAAFETLDSFLNQRGVAYSGGISSPNSAFTAGSRLSVHLAWGTITGREIFTATNQRMEHLKSSDIPDVGQWRRSLNSFRSRLHWRRIIGDRPTFSF